MISPVLLVVAALLAQHAVAGQPPSPGPDPGSGAGPRTHAAAVQAPALALRSDFAAHPIWDDGRAEVNLYEAVEIRYGEQRPAQVAQIVVKEDLLPGSWVKADDWRQPGTVPVLKLNWVLDIPTGVYSYRQMVSVFLRRDDLALVKETLTSHEWCGNTWKGLQATPGGLRLEYRTYWEGEAEGSRALDWPAGAIAADSLPLLVRALPLDAAAARPVHLGEAPLGPTLIGSRVGPVAAARAVFTLQGVGPVPGMPVGSEGAVVQVDTGPGTHRFWVEIRPPHRLLRWERPDGAIYRLMRSRRLAYWDLNGPGDGTALQEGPAFEPPLALPGSP